MAVVINEMDVVSEEKSQPARGSGGSATAAPAKPEPLVIRQIEDTMRHAAERAKRLVAD